MASRGRGACCFRLGRTQSQAGLGGGNLSCQRQRKELSWTVDSRGLIATGGPVVKLIDGLTGREIYTAGAGTFRPDGRRLAAFYNFPDAKIKGPGLAPFTIPDPAGRSGRIIDAEQGKATWSPTGKSIAVATNQGRLQVFALESDAAAPLCLGLRDMRAFAFSPDGRRYAVRSTVAPGPGNRQDDDGRVRVGSLPPGEDLLNLNPADPVLRIFPTRTVSKLALSPSGKYLATAWGGVDLWDLASGKLICALPGHSKDPAGVFMDQGNQITGLAWSPGDRWLASLAANATIKVWDTVTGKEAVSFDLADGVGGSRPIALSWSGDGGLLAACTWGDNMVRVWEIPTGKIVHTFRVRGLPATLSPDGKRLASVSPTSGVGIWDVGTGKEVKSFPLANPSQAGEVLSWSPDGRHLLYGAGVNRIWDVETGSFADTTGWATQAAWDPAGKRVLVVLDRTRAVEAFDASTGKEIKDYGRAPGVAITAPHISWTKDGPLLAVAHEVRWTANGPRLEVQTGPHTLGETSADNGVVELVDLDKARSPSSPSRRRGRR